MDINELLDRAEELGWCIREDHEEWEFSQNSPAGEDFSFSVCTSDVNGPEDLVREIRSYENNFDAAEHAKMWIEAQGRVSGVPDVKTLVKDADAIKLMMKKLASAMEDALEGRTDDDDREASSQREMEKTYEWLLEEFNIDGTAARIIRNVLEYADRLDGDEQYDFLTEMLDGTIGLSDREIRNLCWN